MTNHTITRIDLQDYPNEPGIRVKKFADGWTPHSAPSEITNQRKLTLAEMVAWLQENGWDVYEWEADDWLGIPAGARAFRQGTKKSVRTNYQLKKLRDDLKKKQDAYYREYLGKRALYQDPPIIRSLGYLDLAYVL